MMKQRRYSPSSRIRIPRHFIASFLFFLLGLGFLYFSNPREWLESARVDSPQLPFEKKLVTPSSYDDILVTQVIDGDTLELENGQRVRLIGIDTPESRKNDKAFHDSRRTGVDIEKIVAMGNKAKHFVKQLVENKRVRLEFDVGVKDKYGRLLAYVYLKGADEVFVNAAIIKLGYAAPMTIPPNVKFAKEFHDSYVEAKAEKRGFWEQDALAQK